MEVIVGKTAGFCYGVKRAVDGAKKEIQEKKSKICCLGEIVHNKQVIDELKNEGIKFIENLKDADGETIIRAHGVSKKIEEEADKANIKLIDYTCPNVIKIHEIVNQYQNQGYYVFLLGSKDHPENVGTISYCGENFYVIEKENDTYKAIEALEKSDIKKVLVISQTTYSLEKFYIIEKIIRDELPKNIDLVIKNTICKATELRQKETEDMAKKVDCMIIIGGKNSSNTKKLYEIAKERCKNSICIETKNELNYEMIKNYNKIGIMAGASTPEKSIQEIVEFCGEK